MRIKMGPIEIEYEGSEDFLKQELTDLLSAVSKLYQDSGLPEGEPTAEPAEAAVATGVQSSRTSAMTVTTIAAKLGAKSGADLILAAGASLTRVGSETFARQKLLDEMKKATGYYKKSYGSNLSNYLLTLVREGKLQETAKDTYSLNVGTKDEIEAKLAS
jgi:hypothetical protein